MLTIGKTKVYFICVPQGRMYGFLNSIKKFYWKLSITIYGNIDYKCQNGILNYWDKAHLFISQTMDPYMVGFSNHRNWNEHPKPSLHIKIHVNWTISGWVIMCVFVQKIGMYIPRMIPEKDYGAVRLSLSSDTMI